MSQAYDAVHGAPCKCGEFRVQGGPIYTETGRHTHFHCHDKLFILDPEEWYAAEVDRMKDRSPA